MFGLILDKLLGSDPPTRAGDDLQTAVAVLLVTAARMDDHFDQSERNAIRDLLAERFSLSRDAVAQLLDVAASRSEKSTQIFPYTRTLVERTDAEERIALVEMLWEVAYADGLLDPDEDALVRRVAGLIYVSDFDRGAARQRVRERLRLDPLK